MQYQVSRQQREFEAKEAAELSGVSQALQRDWRRRGLIDPKDGGGRAKMSIDDVISLAVMRRLSEAGFSVKATRALSWHAVVSVMMALQKTPGAFEVKGTDLREEEIPGFLTQIGLTMPKGSFHFFVLPELPDNDPRASGYVFETLDRLTEMAAKDGGFSTGLLIDAFGLAREIAARARRPLITYVLTLDEAEQ